jgi:hypothetical protein
MSGVRKHSRISIGNAALTEVTKGDGRYAHISRPRLILSGLSAHEILCAKNLISPANST